MQLLLVAVYSCVACTNEAIRPASIVLLYCIYVLSILYLSTLLPSFLFLDLLAVSDNELQLMPGA